MVHPEILVVGAGVSGLTVAVRLAEAGCDVQVVADKPPELTTSASAGASWGPYLINDEQIMEWVDITKDALEEIATEPGSGVRLVAGIEVSNDAGEPPEWATKVRDFRP